MRSRRRKRGIGSAFPRVPQRPPSSIAPRPCLPGNQQAASPGGCVLRRHQPASSAPSSCRGSRIRRLTPTSSTTKHPRGCQSPAMVVSGRRRPDSPEGGHGRHDQPSTGRGSPSQRAPSPAESCAVAQYPIARTSRPSCWRWQPSALMRPNQPLASALWNRIISRFRMRSGVDPAMPLKLVFCPDGKHIHSA